MSYERVEDNSKIFKTHFENELHRVIIHGILHLLGYNDSTESQKLKMRKLEESSLDKFWKNAK